MSQPSEPIKKTPRTSRGFFLFLRPVPGSYLASRATVDQMLLRCALRRKRDVAVGQREQGVILAHADVIARVHAGAALTDDDAARVDCLAAVNLHAEALGFRVATIAGGPDCFF